MKTMKRSSKGQIVQEIGDETLVRPVSHFPAAELEDVAGCLPVRKPKSLAQMRSATKREVMRRHELGRY